MRGYPMHVFLFLAGMTAEEARLCVSSSPDIVKIDKKANRFVRNRYCDRFMNACTYCLPGVVVRIRDREITESMLI